MSVRGMEHIGITVPDLDAATKFLVDAFDARVIYDTLLRSEPPLTGRDAEVWLGITPDTSVIAMRFVHLRNGPGVELFEARKPEPTLPIGLGDIGIHHFAVYCDHLESAISRAIAAGATKLAGPKDLSGPEAGTGNRMNYVRAPWGTLIELITFPSGVVEHHGTRRWTPED